MQYLYLKKPHKILNGFCVSSIYQVWKSNLMLLNNLEHEEKSINK